VVVFVHGYRGLSFSSWGRFPSILADEPSFRGKDLIFYGYPSQESPLASAASVLGAFLRCLVEHPKLIIGRAFERSSLRREKFEVQRVLLVGHSLGAVISRKALLAGYIHGESWISKVRMVFFAPAHNGSRHTAGLFSDETNSHLIASALRLAARFSPPLSQLARGSEDLMSLRNGVEQAVSDGAVALLPLAIFHAESENIVEVEDPPFLSADPRAATIVDCGHSTVCKPSRGFREPANRVIDVARGLWRVT
jgi:pimeloyl-ACP methyl ester carboxylesterase